MSLSIFISMNYSLVERDTFKSVLQNIKVILSTQKGTDVHRPEFSVDYKDLIDNPTPINIGKLKAIIVDAIETWEPRAKVKEVKINHSLLEPGRVDVQLLLDIEGEKVAWNFSLP